MAQYEDTKMKTEDLQLLHDCRQSLRRIQERLRISATDGPIGKSAGPVICPHGELEVYCRECDLNARVKLHDAIALVVMEERERCARIAEQGSGCYPDAPDGEREGSWIAAKIRSGE